MKNFADTNRALNTSAVRTCPSEEKEFIQLFLSAGTYFINLFISTYIKKQRENII